MTFLKRYWPRMIWGKDTPLANRKNEAAIIAAYQQVYATAAGKKVLEDILHHAAIYQRLPGDYDASYQLGAQSVGLRVIKNLRVSEQGLRGLEQALGNLEIQQEKLRKSP